LLTNFQSGFKNHKEKKRNNSLRKYKKPTLYKMSTTELKSEDFDELSQSVVENEEETEDVSQSEDIEAHKRTLETLLLQQINRQKLNEKFMTLQYGSDNQVGQSYRDKITEYRRRRNTDKQIRTSNNT